MDAQRTDPQDLDILMANLLTLISQQHLASSRSSITRINHQLETICRHKEMEFYPVQRSVLTKMKRVFQMMEWKHSLERNADSLMPAVHNTGTSLKT